MNKEDNLLEILKKYNNEQYNSLENEFSNFKKQIVAELEKTKILIEEDNKKLNFLLILLYNIFNYTIYIRLNMLFLL